MLLCGSEASAFGVSYQHANIQMKVNNAGFFSLIYKIWVIWDFKSMALETQ